MRLARSGWAKERAADRDTARLFTLARQDVPVPVGLRLFCCHEPYRGHGLRCGASGDSRVGGATGLETQSFAALSLVFGSLPGAYRRSGGAATAERDFHSNGLGLHAAPRSG